MALEDILETIRAESEESASALIASAESAARKVLQRASEEAEQERQRLAASLDDRARLQRSQLISRAHLEAARERRAARESVYQTAVDRVVQRIRELRASSDYEDVLGALLDEAMAVLPNPTGVRVDPEDTEVVQRILATRQLDLEIQPREASLGGVEIVGERRAVDNRLETRLERADEHLRFIAGELVPGLRGSAG